jgi:hypothetical protein
VLGATGDCIAQALGILCSERELHYDVRRGIGMTTFCSLYTGVFQTWWIKTLNAKVKLRPLIANAALKTTLCQFGSVPILYLPLFFLVTGLVSGKDLHGCIAEGQTNYMRIFSRNLCYWIPMQMAQFYFIPPKWHIPFLCAAGCTWSVILSTLGFRLLPSEPSPSCVTSAHPLLQRLPSFDLFLDQWSRGRVRCA